MLGIRRIKLLCLIEVFIILLMVSVPFNIFASSARATDVINQGSEVDAVPEVMMNQPALNTDNSDQSGDQLDVLPNQLNLDGPDQTLTQQVYDSTSVDLIPSTAESEELHATGCIPSDASVLQMHTKSSKQMLKSAALLPQAVDWTADIPTPGNQGIQGSCVAWVTAYAGKSFAEQREHNWGVNITSHQFSPAYIYNQLNGGKDNGISIAQALELMCSQGCDTLDDFPYNASVYLTQPTVAQKQRAGIFKNLNWTCLSSSTVNTNIENIKNALTRGTVIAGVSSFASNYDGELNQTDDNSSNSLLHAICILGYDDNHVMEDGTGGFKFINSWGTKWGQAGYGWMSYTWAKQHIWEAEVMDDSIGDSFTISGQIKYKDIGFDEVSLSFSLVNGNVELPQAVTSDLNGNWGPIDLTLDATYRITPSKAGYSFNPSFIDFNYDNYRQTNFHFEAVTGGPSLVIDLPGKEQIWPVGTMQTIKWNYSGNPGEFKLDLIKGENTVSTIASDVPPGNGDTGSYSWNIPLELLGDKYRIRLTSNEDTPLTATSEEFLISQGIVTSPKGDAVWRTGSTQPISWNYNGTPLGLKIDLYKAGSYVTNIASEVPSEQGTFNWLIPESTLPGTDYQLRFTTGAGDEILTTAYFSIQMALEATITVKRPDQVFSCSPGEWQYIIWKTSGNPGSLKINLLKGGIPVAVLTPNISAGIGNFKWQVATNQVLGTDYQVRISSTIDPSITGISEFFTIGQKASVNITTPLEKQYPGSSCTINWTYTGNPGTFNLDLYLEDYSKKYPIAANIPATGGKGNYILNIPSDLPPSRYDVIISSNNVNGTCYGMGSMVLLPIIYTSPAPGEVWRAGTTQAIRWKFYDTTIYNNQIKIYKGYNEYIATIATDIPGNRESVNWQIPAGVSPSSDYRILISNNVPGKIGGCWSELFSIKAPLAGSITVDEPSRDHHWAPGLYMGRIHWNYTGTPGSTIKVDLFKGGNLVTNLASGLALTYNDKYYSWQVPDNYPVGNDYQVRVSSLIDPEIVGVSDYFTIGKPAYINFTSPGINEDRNWLPGIPHTVRWTYVGEPEAFTLDLYNNGTFYSRLAEVSAGTTGSCSYTWKVPLDQPNGNYQFHVNSNSINGAGCNFSNGFSIHQAKFTIPTKNEIIPIGTIKEIYWVFIGEPTRLTFELVKGSSSVVTTVASNIPSDQGIYNWSIPSTLIPGSDYLLRVKDYYSGEYVGYMEYAFTLQQPSLDGSIKVNSPNHAHPGLLGQTQHVWWKTNGYFGPLKIELLKGGALVEVLGSNISSEIGRFYWVIAANQTPGTDYQVRVSSTLDPSITSTSEYFTIGQRGGITLPLPTGKQHPGSACILNWTYSGNPGSFNLDLYSDDYSVNYPIATNIPATGGNGTFTWNISLDLPPSDKYNVIISSNNVNSAYWAGAWMPIWPIIYTSPTQGEIWRTGTNQTISWKFYDADSYNNTILLYQTNDVFEQILVATIATNIPGNQESYDWLIPTTLSPSLHYRIYIKNDVTGKMEGCWSDYFSIEKSPVSSVSAQNGKISIVLDKVPTVAPVAEDFTATSKVCNGVPSSLPLTNFMWNEETKTVTFNFIPITSTETSQNVVIGLKYKDTTLEEAAVFTVEAGTAVINVDSITVIGADGSTKVINGGTLQMSATVLPVNSTDSSIIWSVESVTGTASINSDGLLTGTGPGTVIVKATANDGSKVTGTQVVTVYESVTASSAPITITSDPTMITVPSNVTDATIKVNTSAASSGENLATLPEVGMAAATSLGTVKVNIPASITITGPSNWQGSINLPTIQANNTVDVIPSVGYTSTVQTVIEVGYGDEKLTFDKAVRILIPGQCGKFAGYYRGGVFTAISKPIDALDTQAWADRNIATESDAAMDVGSDLVIWTKHFTKFVAYTETAASITALSYQSSSIDSSNKVVTLNFNENIDNNLTSLDDLKNAVTFAVDGKNFSTLESSDTVAISGKAIIITFNQALTGNSIKVKLAGKSIKDSSGNILDTEITSETINAGEVDECFIATAAFSSKFAPAVTLLRHFRDQYLLTNNLGRAFVQFYYRNSPPIAHYISGREVLKFVVRILLSPFITVVYLIYHPAIASTALLIFVGFFIWKRKRPRVASEKLDVTANL